MKLSGALQESFNDQINAELASAFLYLSMAAYFEDEHLPGFAHWMRMQNEEETAHAPPRRVVRVPVLFETKEWTARTYAVRDYWLSSSSL